jgi:GNAT superfamily N-acetyltransferase
MGGGGGLVVRAARSAADWQAVRDLCCLTGDGGRPVAPARWPLFAAVWIGPYARLRPEWTLVAEQDGRIVGYLTGCPDSPAFRRAARWRVAVPLAAQVLAGRYSWDADARRVVRRALGLDPGPERRLARMLPPGTLDGYPAHLHVNVAEEARARGVGRTLVRAYLRALAEARIPGVHHLCGPAPVGFYGRLGFHELGRVEVRPGAWVHALGRSVGGPAGPG